ncbi:hypothetical protein Esi_0508_0003 [Ectocarpus siliculosus]|uniref:Uncharacterized protein n=1 Tax=Ectocarpus siliculosus TaxID=2880 RepID=D7G3E0_ECTSI|nr:hypothetical protein Esi_0508_0003 [Ectocarpus siliculosus]|eukprot:CBJ33534.1 hypothetical protein Esi_0508_0003 [Ectocarpus siliculosus]
MKIDGVSLVEPSPADDPNGMGPVAVVIDCDLDALAQKVLKKPPHPLLAKFERTRTAKRERGKN